MYDMFDEIPDHLMHWSKESVLSDDESQEWPPYHVLWDLDPDFSDETDEWQSDDNTAVPIIVPGMSRPGMSGRFDKWSSEDSWGEDYKKTFTRQPLSAKQLKALRTTEGKFTNIRFNKEVGSGAYGSVWISTVDHRKSNGALIYNVKKACKVVPFQPDWELTLRANVDLMVMEMTNTKGLNHSNLMIVEHYLFVGDSKTHFPYSFALLFMEVCQGDLYELIMDSPHQCKLTPLSCKRWFKQISDGVAYLHSLRIVHLDIKSENVLYKFHDPFLKVEDYRDIPTLVMRMTFKLTDFGFSIRYPSDRPMTTNKCVGTESFMAPELWHLIDDPVKYVPAPPCDVYSLGMTLADSYIGEGILSNMGQTGEENGDDIRHILRSREEMSQIWKQQYIDGQLIGLCQQMISTSSKARPTIEQVLNDVWLQ